MKFVKGGFIVALLLTVFTIMAGNSRSVNPQQIFPNEEDALAKALITDRDGTELGMVLITEIEESEAQHLAVWAVIWSGLEPGFHAFHIHSVGTCDHTTESPFTSAAGHFNPDGTDHGMHAGDLPSLYATAEGGAAGIFATDAFTLEDLMDEDGSAFMIHAGRDNYGNIPERYGNADEDTLKAGDAGARVACGVIELNE